MVKTSCLTKRKFKENEEIEITEIVPGDIVVLSAGDMVPADCRIMKSKDLFISESILTGEALPVEKMHFLSMMLKTKILLPCKTFASWEPMW